MNKYELLYIIDKSLTEEARKEVVKKFEDLAKKNNAVDVRVDEWGMKKLAYPINFKDEGYYVLLTFKAESSVPVKLTAELNITEQVVRFNIAKLK